MQVVYHQQTLDLLDQNLILGHSQTLAQWAQLQHLTVPASIEEWYGLPTGMEILRRHSNDDHVFEPQDFQLARYQDFPIIVFMLETQSCCRWGIWLTGSDDPLVLIQDLTKPADWEVCAERFALFTYTQVFDWQYLLAEVEQTGNEDGWCTPAAPAQETILAHLRTFYKPEPSTWTYPGLNVQRFSRAQQRIIISSPGDQPATWALLGATEPARRELRASIQRLWSSLGMWYELFID